MIVEWFLSNYRMKLTHFPKIIDILFSNSILIQIWNILPAFGELNGLIRMRIFLIDLTLFWTGPSLVSLGKEPPVQDCDIPETAGFSRDDKSEQLTVRAQYSFYSAATWSFPYGV